LPAYFFDTSALKHRYISTSLTTRIRRLVSNRNSKVFVSDLTVVELASGFADYCIERGLSQDRFDSMYRSFFRDLATGRITVRESTRRDFEKARQLLRFARVIIRRHLKSADAIIAASCRELAYEKKMPLVFYLCDKRLHATLQVIGAYSTVVKLRYVQP
jgi:predicted nucleic acid-binding protein